MNDQTKFGPIKWQIRSVMSDDQAFFWLLLVHYHIKIGQNEKYYIFIEISIPEINMQMTIWKFSKSNNISSLMSWLYKNIWVVCEWNCLCSMQKLIKHKKVKCNLSKGYHNTQCKGCSQSFINGLLSLIKWC